MPTFIIGIVFAVLALAATFEGLASASPVMLIVAATLANGVVLCSISSMIEKHKRQPEDHDGLIVSLENLRRELEWQRTQIEKHRAAKEKASKL